MDVLWAIRVPCLDLEQDGPLDLSGIRGVTQPFEHCWIILDHTSRAPEGVVVFHTAGNVGFKKTVEKDEVPKALAALQVA